LLDATIVCPSLTALAMDVLAKQIGGRAPTAPLILTQPSSLPSLGQLHPVK